MNQEHIAILMAIGVTVAMITMVLLGVTPSNLPKAKVDLSNIQLTGNDRVDLTNYAVEYLRHDPNIQKFNDRPDLLFDYVGNVTINEVFVLLWLRLGKRDIYILNPHKLIADVMVGLGNLGVEPVASILKRKPT